MSTADAMKYFSNLLNFDVKSDTKISLSSGQKARAASWLTSNNFNYKVDMLNATFNLNELLNDVDLGVRKSNISDGISGILKCEHRMGLSSIGLDIQSILELFPNGLPCDPKSDAELLGIFTLKEISYAQSKNNPIDTLAGIFAAKEAVQKCLDNKVKLNNVEILPDAAGRPNIAGFNISISHSGGNAIAIAIPKDTETQKYSKNYDLISGLQYQSGVQSKTISYANNKITYLAILLLFILQLVTLLKIWL